MGHRCVVGVPQEHVTLLLAGDCRTGAERWHEGVWCGCRALVQTGKWRVGHPTGLVLAGSSGVPWADLGECS